MQLDLAVLQLCDDCVVVKVLGGVVELPDKRVSLLVLHGIVELQLVSKELRLQWRLQRRPGGREGVESGRRRRRQRGKEDQAIYSRNYVLLSYQTLGVHLTSH